MSKLFRGLILLAIACFAVAIVLPGESVNVTVPLPQPGDPVDVMGSISALSTLLGALAFVVVAISALGMLLFKRWARPSAVVATPLAVACIAVAFSTAPFSIAATLTLMHDVILGVSMAAWVAALWLLRTPELRARFGA